MVQVSLLARVPALGAAAARLPAAVAYRRASEQKPAASGLHHWRARKVWPVPEKSVHPYSTKVSSQARQLRENSVRAALCTWLDQQQCFCGLLSPPDDCSAGKLCACRVRVNGNLLKLAEINFLCVHKKLRSKRLAPLLIRVRCVLSRAAFSQGV